MFGFSAIFLSVVAWRQRCAWTQARSAAPGIRGGGRSLHRLQDQLYELVDLAARERFEAQRQPR